MALVPAVGTISYNGYTFGVQTETTGLEINPVYDSAGRTVSYNVWKITLKTVIDSTAGGGSTTDVTLLQLRQQLLQPGGEFHYSNKGVGGVDINVGGSGANPSDILWGPKPRFLRWSPRGSAVTAEVVWTVEIALPYDCGNQLYAFAPLEFNYRVAYDLDRSGYSTRHYSGFLRIPGHRAGGPAVRQILDSVDHYREKIVPPWINGFRRIPGNFDISEDKTRLDFSITDEEMPPNIPPAGCIDAQASASVSSSLRPHGFMMWNGTLEASYELAKGVDRSTAFQMFLTLLTDRMKTAKDNSQIPADKKLLLLTSLSMSEPEIYGRRTASFNATYTFTTTLPTILKASGLWNPVPNSNWKQWYTSLAGNSLGPRGNARLSFSTSDDYIIDLCDVVPEQLPQPRGGSKLRSGALGGQAKLIAAPDKDNAWVGFENRLEPEIEAENAELKPLPPGVVGPVEPTSIVQARAAGSYFVNMVGYAARAGFGIQPPVLKKVGNVFVIPTEKSRSRTWVAHNWMGVAIHACVWNMRYLLPRRPTGQIQVPPNPMRDEAAQKPQLIGNETFFNARMNGGAKAGPFGPLPPEMGISVSPGNPLQLDINNLFNDSRVGGGAASQ